MERVQVYFLLENEAQVTVLLLCVLTDPIIILRAWSYTWKNRNNVNNFFITGLLEQFVKNTEPVKILTIKYLWEHFINVEMLFNCKF